VSQIFISHIEEDGKVVEEIARGLEEAGYTTCYYERDFMMTRHYLEDASDAIKQAGVVIVLMSPGALKSNEVKVEVLIGHELKKPFIPLIFNMTYTEYQERRPDWAMAALIAYTARCITQEEIQAILPQIINGAKVLGLTPAYKLPSPQVGYVLSDLISLHEKQVGYDEVLPLLKQALAILEGDLTDVAKGLNDLAALYESYSKYDEALPLYRRAVQIAGTALGADHPNTETYKRNLETCQAATNQQGES